MKENLAFKELTILLEMRLKLESCGRSLHYDESNRLRELRIFLDSLPNEEIEYQPDESEKSEVPF